MKITFRQGIVSRQSGQFLQVVGDNVDLLATNRSTTVTLAVRDTDYTHSEDNTVASAWVGPFPVGVLPSNANAYLYWDFDPLTFERTFGWTTLPPAAQSVEPGSGNTPIVGVVPTAASPVIAGSFEVAGQYVLTTGKVIGVVNSTANDGLYRVDSATYSTTSGTTTIVVDSAIADATVDGDINLDFDIYLQPLRQTGRSWYDTANNIHYELNAANQWIEVLRVFAARLNNATSFFSMSKDADFTGTQIGNVSSVFAGRVLFGETGNPITRDDGTFFTTEDQFFTNQSRVDALRLESNVSRAKSVSGGTLAAFGIVAWVGDGEITTAQYDDTGSTVVGVLTENTNNSEVGAVIVQGTVTNPAWAWDSLIVGKSLWIENGALVSTDPHISDPLTYLTKQVPVARVLSGDTVIFEQGLGGIGPQGPKGTLSDLPLANNELVQGVVSLSHAPVNDIFPIAAGENHPVLLSGPYSVDGHGHTALEISFETIPGSIDSTDVQNAIVELNTKKLSLSGGTMLNILTLSGPPSADLDAATKAYVDALAQGIDAKEAAVVATTVDFGGVYSSVGGTGGTGNITNATISSLDGTYGTDYSLIVGSRILVKDQTDTLENGIYDVTALDGGSPPVLLSVERSSDFDSNDEIRAGSYVLVRAGFDLAGTGWALTDIHPDDDIELNVHPITWTLVSSATSGNNWLYANNGNNFTTAPISTGANSIALGDNATTASRQIAIAIGKGADATGFGDGGIAFGYNAIVGGRRDIVMGYNAQGANNNDDKISIGTNARATGYNSLALQENAHAYGQSTIAIGFTATASSTNAISMGATTTASGSNTIAIGSLATASGSNSIAFGSGADAPLTATNSTAIGRLALAADDDAVAIGFNPTADLDAVAIGTDAWAQSIGAVAIGIDTDSAIYSIAIGRQAQALGGSCVAVGARSVASGISATALGFECDATLINQTSVGSWLDNASVTTDVPYSTKLGYGIADTNKNLLHLFSKGKLELYGEEAQFIIPNYAITGSPIELPANAEEGGLIYDSVAKGLQLYDGVSWSALGGGGASQTPWLSNIDAAGFSLTTTNVVNGVSNSFSMFTGDSTNGNAGGIALSVGAGYESGANFTIDGGSCSGSEYAGGSVIITGGANLNYANAGGQITLYGGSDFSDIGKVKIESPSAGSGRPGGIDILVGAATGNFTGGGIDLEAGDSIGVAGAGSITLKAGIGLGAGDDGKIFLDGEAVFKSYTTVLLPATIQAGAVVYDTTTSELKLNDDASWAAVGGGGGASLPSYEKIVIGGSPVSQVLTTTITVAATAGSPTQIASIQVFRNGILQNEDTTIGGGIDGDFEVTGANELTFAADALQPGGVVIIYVFG